MGGWRGVKHTHLVEGDADARAVCGTNVTGSIAADEKTGFEVSRSAIVCKMFLRRVH